VKSNDILNLIILKMQECIERSIKFFDVLELIEVIIKILGD
jgi:hypothetical protein